MGKRVKKGLAVFLSLALLIMCVPAGVFAVEAANDQNVITGASYEGTAARVNGTDITVSIPYKSGDTTVNVDRINFTWASGVTANGIDWAEGYQAVQVGESIQGTVNYKVSGSDEKYTAGYTVYVERAEKVDAAASGSINKTLISGKSISFSTSDFESKYKKNDGDYLGAVKITENGSSESGEFKISEESYVLGDTINYSDLSSLSFTSSVSGDKKYTVTYYESGNDNPVGTVNLSITVNSPEIPTVDGGTLTQKETKAFPVDKVNTEFMSVSSSQNDFDKIVFTELPLSSKGILYTGYESASSKGTSASVGTECKMSDFLDDRVTFVPNASYTGSVTVKYSAYDRNGESYSGTVTFTVISSDPADIKATITANETYSISRTDINSKVKAVSGGKDVEYIKFTTLPSSSKGYLYYDGSSKITSTSAEYYYSGTSSSKKYMNKLSFVPSGSTGTATIKYRAYTTDEKYYDGSIIITINEQTSELSTISYTVDQDRTLDFSVSDFKNALSKKTSKSLNYVKFELPSTSKGVLYYDYSSSQSSPAKVSSSTKYYRTGSGKNLIGKITFVPKTNYTGTVTIDYTAYDSDGEKFEGSVAVKVGVSDKLDNITYKVGNSKVLTLSSADINTEFKDADGGNLSYVKFTLPSSTYGYLYYDYKSASDTGSFVKSSEKFYRTGSGVNLLSKVSFEPNSGYSGTFDLKYTAYGSDGAEYAGVIRITVTDDGINTDSSAYFKDVKQDYSWAAGKIDYLYKKGIVKGTESASSGMLYSPAANITRGDFILMLYRAFNLKAAVTDNFSDVPKDSYYYDAIGAAKALGIAQGAYGLFNPAESLSREDAMVLIDRAIKVTGRKTLPASSDVSRFGDRSKIASYATGSVGTLVKAGVIKGYDDGNFAPKGLLTRAEMAVVLYNVEML